MATEIKFSLYGDHPSPMEDPAFLLGEFQARHHVILQVSRMEREEAWPRLLEIALHGGGPDVSQIGAIWTSTLAGMNVLRPFNHHDITSLGGVGTFFAPAWQNAMLSKQTDSLAIPFTTFTYVVLYRRDLLLGNGIDEQTAFASAEAMTETVKRLQSAGVHSPLILPSGNPYRARVHNAASWVWGAGGDYMSSDERYVLFDQPEALTGLKAFFELHRFMARSDHNLPYQECIRRFSVGDAAIIIVGSNSLPEIQRWTVGQVMDNLGVAALPGVPWVGGSNLVIWKETQMYPPKERAALEFVRFLTSSDAQVKLAVADGAIPARPESLSQVNYQPAVTGQVIDASLRRGRSYWPARIWVRLVNELARTFDNLTTDILADTTLTVEQALAKHLVPVAKRFRLMLSR